MRTISHKCSHNASIARVDFVFIENSLSQKIENIFPWIRISKDIPSIRTESILIYKCGKKNIHNCLQIALAPSMHDLTRITSQQK